MGFKLLAVAVALSGGVAYAETPRVLPSGAPAAGNTMGKPSPDEIERIGQLPVPPPPRPSPSPPSPTEKQVIAVRKLLSVVFGFTAVAQPRQLPGGHPACGNVASRAVPKACS